MSKWIPKWAKYYRIERPYPADDSSVNIYFAASFTDGYKQLEYLMQELAILDVCHQIKDKPLHSRIDVIGQNGNTGEHYDSVNKPEHYQGEGIECIDAIKAALGIDAFVAHCRTTAIKYAWRSGKKRKHAEDLRKGAWYLTKAAEALDE